MDRSLACLDLGIDVYIIERNLSGIAREVSGYMLLAISCGAVIVSAFINDLVTIDETLEYHAEETVRNDTTHLYVYPVEDCFLYKQDALDAMEKELAND